MTPLSVLDLVPFSSKSTTAHAIRNAVELAQTAERLGFKRFWLAEHHSLGHTASSAPEIIIAHVAASTSKIQIGAGGMMLNNHPPLRIAEVFRTLAAIYPGRIELGIGRTHGGHHSILRALRAFPSDAFEGQLRELLALSEGSLDTSHPLATVHVVPADVDTPPIWVLGSGGGTAELAGSLGLGYAYGRHLRDTPPGPAFEKYRAAFRPSKDFSQPHAVLCVSVICAPTQEEANKLATPYDVAHIHRAKGEFSPLPTASEVAGRHYDAEELRLVEENRRRHFIGTPSAVVEAVRALANEAKADEVMITTMAHGQAERLRSYELFVDEWNRDPVSTPKSNRTKVQRNPYAYIADLGRETVLMSVEHGEYFKVDPIALDIWNRLEAPIEVEQLCADLSGTYQGDPNVIAREVSTLLDTLERHKLLL